MDKDTQFDPKAVKRELFAAVTQLSARGLLHATKWVAEILDCFDQVQCDLAAAPEDPRLIDDVQDIEKYYLAKSYFDLKEYLRAAHVLQDCEGSKAVFLRCYSRFLSGEKRRNEEAMEVGERHPVVNKELASLSDYLYRRHVGGRLDGFCTYLYGVIHGHLAEQPVSLTAEELSQDSSFARKPQVAPVSDALMSTKEARLAKQRHILVSAIRLYPWNWAAWLDLASTLKDGVMLAQVDKLLPSHFFKPFWRAHCFLELQQNQQAFALYEELAELYPTSSYIKTQLAIALYNLQDFETAEGLFDTLLKFDPHRLTSMDIYSNILYVSGNAPKLSYLAYKAASTDKYSTETCCIIGNYYSLKNEHEKAVLYFERALKLNPRYMAAWTLMGHEYLELKNTGAAISAYRKAVDINRMDYRAWYGLGQTYEILQMPLYALYYFGKACELRPYDARMWCAMANCYESIGHTDNAIQAYKRALCNQDREGIALSKLAKLYESLQENDKASYYYKKNLDRRDAEGIEGQDTIDALTFLARHCKEIGDFDDAAKYASRLLDFSGREKEEAKSLLREIHSTQKLFPPAAGGGAVSTSQRQNSSNISIDMSDVSNQSMDDILVSSSPMPSSISGGGGGGVAGLSRRLQSALSPGSSMDMDMDES